MTRVLAIHARALDWALTRPILLGAACLTVLVIGGYFGYTALGSDLLPEMD